MIRGIAKEVTSAAVSGQVIDPVVISASELASLPQSREMFDELRDLLSNAVIPAIGGRYHSVSVRVETLLGEIHLRSGGFLARHWRESERFAMGKGLPESVCRSWLQTARCYCVQKAWW